MFWALAVILLAFAGFTVLVLRGRRADGLRDPRIDVDQLKGFVYVGAVALAGLAVTVVVVGLVAAPNGVAEGLAVLGFFGYLLYLVAAAVVLYVAAARAQPGAGSGPGGGRGRHSRTGATRRP